MGVKSNRAFGRGDQQPTGHSEMNDPLSERPERFALVSGGPERFALVCSWRVCAGLVSIEGSP